MQSLFNKFNNIDFSVYSAPPRPFICLLSPFSSGSVISGTCLQTRTVPDRTPAIGTHRGGGVEQDGGWGDQLLLPKPVVSEDYLGCVWALQTQSYNSPDWLTLWSVLSKEVKSCLRGRFTVWLMCRNARIKILIFSPVSWANITFFFWYRLHALQQTLQLYAYPLMCIIIQTQSLWTVLVFAGSKVETSIVHQELLGLYNH